jgi:hypothetical protein
MNQKRSTIAVDTKFLTNLKIGLHAWVADHANTNPGANKPGQRGQIGMQFGAQDCPLNNLYTARLANQVMAPEHRISKPV